MKIRYVVLICAFFIIQSTIQGMAQSEDRIIVLRSSHSGQFIATISLDNKIEIRLSSTMEVVRVLTGHMEQARALAWSHDDAFIAAGSSLYDETLSRTKSVIYIFQVESGNLISFSPEQFGTIFDLSWNRANTGVLSGTEEIDGGMLSIFDIMTGTQRAVSFGNSVSLEYSPLYAQLAIGTVGGNIILVNGQTYLDEVVPSITDENLQPAFFLAWHPSQLLISSGHMDGMIRIWNATSGNTLHVLSAAAAIGMDAEYSQMVLALAFDSRGTRLRSFNREGRIRVWDTQTWALIAEQIVPGPIYAADWDKTGTTLYYGTDSAIPRVVRAPDLPSPPPTPTALPHPIFPPPGGGDPACPGGGGEWMWVDGELIFVCGVSWE